jgi:hypothetical protein
MERRAFIKLAGALPLVPYAPWQAARLTEVSIQGEAFHINGVPTYQERTFNGHKIEGLLMNTRMVQGIFEDRNPETVGRWAYPDTGRFDPDRNTREFIAAMPSWAQHGVICFTICLQGGSPGNANFGPARGRGGGRGGGGGAGGAARAGGAQTPAGAAAGAPRGAGPGPAGGNPAAGRGRGAAGPTLENTAFNPDGSLRLENMERLAKILDRADELGMVAIVSYFYFGQDQRLADEAAVKRAVANATNWILDRGYRNVMIEINNECGLSYEHDILNPQRVHELIELVKGMTRNGRRLLVTTSWPGPTANSFREHPDTPATSNVARVSDFTLIHGNGANNEVLLKMIRATRGLAGFKANPQPVMINEDPNFAFDQPENNLLTSVYQYVSWGYYDQAGFQSPPVNWTINTDNKRKFFELVRTVTGY